jgi:Domain of unknown function (DUF5916)/Carbohydrate family 9 binding domain-like
MTMWRGGYLGARNGAGAAVVSFLPATSLSAAQAPSASAASAAPAAPAAQAPPTPGAAAPAAGGVPAPPPPQFLPRAKGPIDVDGDLSDPGWKDALKIDRFYETSPADNIPAKVKTTVWLTYDERYFYIGVQCDDPDPKKIRAPFVDRDSVLGTDDNIAVFLDTRNDHRSAFELRVNPRGIQGDAIFDDANGNEDFSPDFFYDTAARITAQGWSAEYRIPFSSLRFPKTDPQTWGILIWRNYPRDFRYAFHSAPIPRDSTCLICHTHELTGLTGLPSSHHLVAAPYATAQQRAEPRNPTDPRSPLVAGNPKTDAGLDVKWNPTAASALDVALNPDFSQVEADVAQISVNSRFALFFPEKRPFFLEGTDLFDTPIQAVYTRTITSPRWGLRGTGKLGSSAFTLLVAEDRGGGLVTLPGPVFSDFAPQDFSSKVVAGRLRQDFGASFGGFLLTDREIAGGGHNRVLGPDFQWRPGKGDTLTGQFLYSDTRNPNRPDLFPDRPGQGFSSHAATLFYNHQSRGDDWSATYKDYGDDFRADVGFVPQNGFREGTVAGGLRFFPQGLLRFVRAYAVADYLRDTHGQALGHDFFPGVFAIGARNLNAFVELHPSEQVKTPAGRLLTDRYVGYSFAIDPNSRFSRITVAGRAGQAVDFVNSRVGSGATVNVRVTVRPTDHLELLGEWDRQWLDVHAGQTSGQLFVAQVNRLKATYIFSARSLLRLIGQYVTVDRDPALYLVAVPRRSGSFLGSLLYSYKLNWQTVLFLGYGDDRLRTETDALLRTDRTLFLKVSYALQR